MMKLEAKETKVIKVLWRDTENYLYLSMTKD